MRSTLATWRSVAFVRRRSVGSVPAEGEDAPLTMHTLRHVFASLLIAEGFDVTFVSRQLGHANPAITLRIYARLFDGERHAADARARLDTRFGNVLDRSDASALDLETESNVLELQGFRSSSVPPAT